MPHYDYECKECRTAVSIKASISEKENGLDLSCSHCGSKEMEQVFNNMAVVSGSLASPSFSSPSSSSSSHSHSGGCGCGTGACGL